MIEKCKQIGIDIIDISPSPTHPVRTRDQASQFPLLKPYVRSAHLQASSLKPERPKCYTMSHAHFNVP
jgi:hypothetical protein